ncbi:hypothetical protein EJ05DRAFT_442088 [Pseudovirgaria hyperparasitica]|uniref:Uncharacterized protein n=1 Tax=Pseudovirgaria hyperparasitica TaxID=470096 RepID=A0A6A6W1E8_9PEZI|nr:uncharacterized protein EJ05DRAFT_442088 [Pseudovirgaria hyperparasitica]KAF2755804.1 hypothetical protein EJ05DRAFT_442088 [Pseudovirgaria hyperparasitica]
MFLHTQAHSTLKRQKRTQFSPIEKDPEQNITKGRSWYIPGPAWLWLEPVVQPFRAYGAAQRRRPHLVQWLSTITIYFLGDLSAQRALQESVDEVEQEPWYDTGRALRSLTIGAISSIPSYRWFIWLGESFNYSSKFLSLATKVAVNQVIFTPVFNTYFFGMQSLLSGATLAEAGGRIKNTVPTSWWNSCKLWPAVTAFSFTFIPLEYRSVFAGVIAIGWQTYLSMLNQKAAKAERDAIECAVV